MDGIADMGGTQGWGRTRPPLPDEPVFGEPWQSRAFALALVSIRLAGWNIDAFRHALERLSRSAYLDDGYFGRWLNAAELVLTDSGVLSPGGVDARARSLRGQHVVEPPPSQLIRPDYEPTAPGSLRALDAAPAYAIGQRVRAKNISPSGHSRLPRYVRGRSGVVESVQPASVLPDTNAHFLGENPQHVYTVRFHSHELWGSEADSFVLTIELFESYLEEVG